MANLDQAPSRSMPNLLHVLPAFADESELRLNTIVELNSNTINKYELITETGHLKLDRVGYSSLAYPFAYGCIPRTWDEDGDPLDIEIVNVTEPLIPGSIVEARIIGIMTFDDGGEDDDKVIAASVSTIKRTACQAGGDWENAGGDWENVGIFLAHRTKQGLFAYYVHLHKEKFYWWFERATMKQYDLKGAGRKRDLLEFQADFDVSYQGREML